jgi:hypothetical protein
MIRDDDDLQVVREQLGRAERALASLRSEITNERNFALYSEAYVDQINELKAQIQEYENAAKKRGTKPAAQGRSGKPRKAS